MPGVIATLPKFQFSNALGLPMSGGTLTSYLAGTTTLAATYQDEALTAANTNPIALDSRGECTLWMDSTKNYKFILKNALGVVQWTVDSITNSTAFAKALDAQLRADLAAQSGALQVGFVASGTGAIAQTVQSKNRQVVNVKDFGAVGDGVTDDTAAINAALASGFVGTIDLATSVISSTLLPRSGQILRGGKLIAASGAFVHAVKFNGVANAGLDNVEILGNFDFGVWITGSVNIKIENCNIHDIGSVSPEYGFGIIVGEYADPTKFSSDIKISGNTIKNIFGNGAQRGDGILLGFCSQVTVSDNLINTVNRMGIAVVSAANNISIVNNHIVNAALCGVDCEPDSPLPTCYGIRINGNTITNYARSGFSGVGVQLFAVDVHSDVHDVIVSNNVITPGSRATQVFHCQNSAYGIQFISNEVLSGGSLELFLKTSAGNGSNKIIVSNNVAVAGNIKSFIDLSLTSNVIIANNQFAGSNSVGSFFVKLVDSIFVNVSNNISNFTESFAISAIGSCSNLSFTGNITKTTGHGFDFLALSVGIDGLLIKKNIINSPASFNGIRIQLSSGYLRNLDLIGNVIPISTSRIDVSNAAAFWTYPSFNTRSLVVSPSAGQMIFEMNTNKHIQYLGGAWVAPS